MLDCFVFDCGMVALCAWDDVERLLAPRDPVAYPHDVRSQPGAPLAQAVPGAEWADPWLRFVAAWREHGSLAMRPSVLVATDIDPPAVQELLWRQEEAARFLGQTLLDDQEVVDLARFLEAHAFYTVAPAAGVTRADIIDFVATIIEAGDLLLLVGGKPVRASSILAREDTAYQDDDSILDAVERLSQEPTLTNPRWEQVGEEPRRCRPDEVFPHDTVTLYADATGLFTNERIRFVIFDNEAGDGRPVAVIHGRHDDGLVTSENWSVPSRRGLETTDGVTFYFYATGRGVATEMCPIPMATGVEVLLELDLSAPDPEDDTLLLLDDRLVTVMEIAVASANAVPPNFKSLFLPVEPDVPYTLIRRYSGLEEGDEDPLFVDMTPRELLEMGMDPPRLEAVVILNGVLAPEWCRAALDAAQAGPAESGRAGEGGGVEPVEPFPHSLEPVANRFFLLKSSRSAASGSGGPVTTLVATDEMGRLRSVGPTLEPKQIHVQRPRGFPVLELDPVAPGMARHAFMVDKKGWQSKLLEVAAGLKPQPFKAIPVMFSRRHLKRWSAAGMRGPELEARRALDAFAARPHVGYVFPKIRYVFLLVPAVALAREIETAQLPKARWWKAGTSREKAVQIPGLVTSLAYEPRLGRGKRAHRFAVYVVTSADMALEDRVLYRVSLPGSLFDSRIRAWLDRSESGPDLVVSVRVAFEVSTLMADIDFHLLAPVSLEDALIDLFPEEFADTLEAILRDEKTTEDPKKEKQVGMLRTWVDRYDFVRKKQKLAFKVVDAERDFFVSTLETLVSVAQRDEESVERGMSAMRGSAKGAAEALLEGAAALELSEESKKWIGLVSSAYSGVKTLAQTWKKWEVLEGAINKDRFLWTNIRTIRDVVEGSATKKLWTAANWHHWAMKQLFEGELPHEFALQLGELRDTESIGKLIKEGIPDGTPEGIPTVATRADTIGKMSGTAGMVLDSVAALCAFIDAWTEARKASNAIALHRKRLVAMLTAADSRWKLPDGRYAPELAMQSDLTGQRTLVDSLLMNLNDKEWELVKSSATLILNALAWVPAVGVFARMALLGVETFQAGRAVLELLVSVTDEVFLSGWVACWKDLHKARKLLDKKSGTNRTEMFRTFWRIRYEDRQAVPEDDPNYQLRVRTELLFGLAALMDRCGSRFGDPEAFERKVKQYRIDEYVELFFSGSSGTHFPQLRLTGISMAELWWSSVALKDPAHRDEAVMDAVRGKKSPAQSGGDAGSGRDGTPEREEKPPRFSGYPLTYHRWFPIHYMQTGSILQLARVFCRDYTGIDVDAIRFSRIYFLDGDTWITPREAADNEEFTPTPLTPIRIVVVFEANANLLGLPVSIQLIRTDTWPDTTGPVYKMAAERLAVEPPRENLHAPGTKEELKARVLAYKGLLPGTTEEAFDSNQVEEGGAPFCGVVCYPFYVYKGDVKYGAKPCGHFPISPDNWMDVAFKMKIGPRRFALGTSEADDMDFRITFPWEVREVVRMMTDREFCAHKSFKEPPGEIFRKWVRPAAILLNRGGVWRVYTEKTKVVTPGPDDFRWNQAFEMILLFSGYQFTREFVERGKFTFDASANVRESVWLWDPVGPAYPVQCVAFKVVRSRVVAERRFFDILLDALRTRHIIGPTETVDPAIDGQESADPGVDGRAFLGNALTVVSDRLIAYMGAVRIRFGYQIVGEDGVMVCDALKPFGKVAYRVNKIPAWADPKDYRYNYVFGLSIPTSGGGHRVVFDTKVSFPPLTASGVAPERDGRKWVHLSKDAFVTKESLWPLATIHECDYES